MTTIFIHPITGVHHFHECSSLCFTKNQIDGIKEYMNILLFFHCTRKRPDCLNSVSFQRSIRIRLEKLAQLKRTIGLTKLKRRTLAKKIMEILIQEDEDYINKNQVVVHYFLENQFVEYTKDFKKFINFRRTSF